MRARRDGYVGLRVKCPSTEEFCRVDLRLRRNTTRLARALFVVAGGKSTRQLMQLPRGTRSRLAQVGALELAVRIKAR